MSGKIVAVFPTGHAIGIKADDRNEYLIHLGLDTVNFKGEGFAVHIVLDQRVNPGDPLVDVDLEFFKKHKVSMVCPILVVNANSRKIRLLKEGVVQSQEKIFLRSRHEPGRNEPRIGIRPGAIARHRLALMKYCVVTALLCSLISLAAQQFNDNLIPLGTTLAINLVFLFGLDWVMLKALRNEPYSYRDFSQFAKYFKALLPLFGMYAVILAAGVFALQAMIHFGAVLLVLPALLGLSVIFLNCINHLTLFSMIETHQSAWQALKGGGEDVFSIQKTDLAHCFKNDDADLVGKSGGVRAQCVCLRSADRRCTEKCAGNYGSFDRSLFLNESQLSDSKRWHAAGCQLYRNRVRNDLWRLLFESKEDDNEIKEFI